MIKIVNYYYEFDNNLSSEVYDYLETLYAGVNGVIKEEGFCKVYAGVYDTIDYEDLNAINSSFQRQFPDIKFRFFRLIFETRGFSKQYEKNS